jgi:hypothetical protein
VGIICSLTSILIVYELPFEISSFDIFSEHTSVQHVVVKARLTRQEPRHHPINKSGLYYEKLTKVSVPAHETTADRQLCDVALQFKLTGLFFRDEAGEYLYEPHGCRLQRFTAAQARGILVNRTVVFYGDSLTRYHLMNLAVFLATGKLMERYAGTPETAPRCVGAGLKGCS